MFINSAALPVFTKVPNNKTVDVSYLATIECSAELRNGDKATITWYKDGKVMGPSVRYYTDSVTSSLHILSALVDDSGFYTCEANNEAGKIEASMYLTVKQKQIGNFIMTYLPFPKRGAEFPWEI